jgi:leader peptidase (prepilin peptidase)/N-methyltransferase
MQVILPVVFALLGTAVGSFLNVCIDRLPVGKSLLYPRSHCDSCQHPLSPLDLIPVFSYLWLRRHCRYCQAPIPSRPFWVEVGTGSFFGLAYWHFGLNAELGLTVFYGSLFIVLGVIDLEHGLILDKILYPAAALALIISIFQPSEILPFPWPARLNGIIGGAIGFIYFLLPFILSRVFYKRDGMGEGDVKMAGLIGLVTGFPLVLVALIMVSILGGLVAGILLLFKIKQREEAIPFAPFLSLTTIITLLWGNDILSWYLGLF